MVKSSNFRRRKARRYLANNRMQWAQPWPQGCQQVNRGGNVPHKMPNVPFFSLLCCAQYDYQTLNIAACHAWRTLPPNARWWSSVLPPTMTTDGSTLARWEKPPRSSRSNLWCSQLLKRSETRWPLMQFSMPELSDLPTTSFPSSG